MAELSYERLAASAQEAARRPQPLSVAELEASIAPAPGLLERLGQTWPARLGRSIYEAATLPGDVYAGRVDPRSDEGIGRAVDLAGLVMGGTFAGAPAGAVGAGAVRPKIRGYHGSPYEFEKFDLSRVGTGQGQARYGHGVNIAAEEADAQQFRQMALAQHPDNPGAMYEVAVAADRDQMLDWHLPVSQQPQHVQDRFAAAGLNTHTDTPKWLAALKGKSADTEELTGEGVYHRLAQALGGTQAASKALREAGIMGVSHRLDQSPNRAYVVFDDALIDILRRYGLAGFGAFSALQHLADQGET